MNDYTYEGQAVFHLKKPLPENTDTVKILKVDHMIPVNITFEVNGKSVEVNGAVDYATRTINFLSNIEGMDETKLRNAFLEWIDQENESEDKHTMPVEVPNFEVPDMPWTPTEEEDE